MKKSKIFRDYYRKIQAKSITFVVIFINRGLKSARRMFEIGGLGVFWLKRLCSSTDRTRIS